MSPDAGGAERARAYAKRLDAELAIIDKRRTRRRHGRGDERDRRRARPHLHPAGRHHRHRRHDHEGGAGARRTPGAERVLACAVHGVLSGPAIERIEKSPLEQLIVTNYHPARRPAGRQCKKIVVLSVARLLGQAIRSIHEETSVSSLFV